MLPTASLHRCVHLNCQRLSLTRPSPGRSRKKGVGFEPVPVPADNLKWNAIVESKSQAAASVHTLRGSKHGPARSAVVAYLLWFLNRLEPASRNAQGEGSATALAGLEGTTMAERAFNIATRSACQLLRLRGSMVGSHRDQWNIKSGATQTIQEDPVKMGSQSQLTTSNGTLHLASLPDCVAASWKSHIC